MGPENTEHVEQEQEHEHLLKPASIEISDREKIRHALTDHLNEFGAGVRIERLSIDFGIGDELILPVTRKTPPENPSGDTEDSENRDDVQTDVIAIIRLKRDQEGNPLLDDLQLETPPTTGVFWSLNQRRKADNWYQEYNLRYKLVDAVSRGEITNEISNTGDWKGLNLTRDGKKLRITAKNTTDKTPKVRTFDWDGNKIEEVATRSRREFISRDVPTAVAAAGVMAVGIDPNTFESQSSPNQIDQDEMNIVGTPEDYAEIETLADMETLVFSADEVLELIGDRQIESQDGEIGMTWRELFENNGITEVGHPGTSGVSDPFNTPRTTSRGTTIHTNAIDLPGPAGRPSTAIFAGSIVGFSNNGVDGRGNYVPAIRSGSMNNIEVSYGHNQPLPSDSGIEIGPDTLVEAGAIHSVIGGERNEESIARGENTTGPHIDLMMTVDEVPINLNPLIFAINRLASREILERLDEQIFPQEGIEKIFSTIDNSLGNATPLSALDEYSIDPTSPTALRVINQQAYLTLAQYIGHLHSQSANSPEQSDYTAIAQQLNSYLRFVITAFPEGREARSTTTSPEEANLQDWFFSAFVNRPSEITTALENEAANIRLNTPEFSPESVLFEWPARLPTFNLETHNLEELNYV